MSHQFSNEHIKDIYTHCILTHTDDITKVKDYEYYFSIIDVEALARVVKKKVSQILEKDITIKVQIEKFSNTSLYGLVMRKGNQVTIGIGEHLNECWRRFTICKELLQLYVDFESPSESPDKYNLSKQLERLLKDQTMLFDGIKEHKSSLEDFDNYVDDEVEPELIALIMTIDMVVPAYAKKEFKGLTSFVSKKAMTTYDIASYFKMPELMIDFYKKNIHETSLGMLSKEVKSPLELGIL